jgi:DNA-binding response OmpR family regulator
MKPRRVLVVDDEADVRLLVAELLKRAGYEVLDGPDGKAGLRLLHESVPDLVILDISMPILDGWQTLERIRDLSDVPVIMLTARDGELEKVRGLKAGADDYVTKPFGRQELLARVEALLRRGTEPMVVEDYDDGVVLIDVAQRRVAIHGAEVQLTPLEFKLLSALVRNSDQVLDRERLLEQVWGDAHAVSRDQVKLYVGYLRRKLSPDDPQAFPIETVRGFGYRYRKPGSE